MKRTIVAVAWLGLAMLLASTDCFSQRYTFTELPPSGSYDNYSAGVGVNSFGIVAGWSYDSTFHKHAFRYDMLRGMQELGSLTANSDIWCTGMNGFGTIVGTKVGPVPNGLANAFVARLMSTTVQPLALPAGTISSSAGAINLQGHIAGVFRNSLGDSRLFLFISSTSKTYDLGAAPASSGPSFIDSVSAINESGQIVGAVYLPAVNGHDNAFVYSGCPRHCPGEWKYLGFLPGDFLSWANDINDRGEIVGMSGTVGDFHAFYYKNGVMTALPGLAANTYHVVANGINNRGQIVGYAETSDSSFHAVMWTKRSAKWFITDLNTFMPANSGFVLTIANAISDNGYITGEATNTNFGVTHGFLLTPGHY